MKVLFICGSDHSGSTFLDFLLSNHNSGLSLGEVRSLFIPTRVHHINPICNCGIKNCYFWKGVKEKGKNKLYKTIFERNPNVKFLVDSSKELTWVYDRIRELNLQRIDYEIIVIWKDPKEIAISLLKRKKLNGFYKIWLNYYRNLKSFAEPAIFISYKDLALCPTETIFNIFDRLDIEKNCWNYKYWEKRHHSLFGSASSRIHLHGNNSAEFNRLMEYINKNQTKNTIKGSVHHKTIKYNKIDFDKIPQNFLKELVRSNSINDILKWLSKSNTNNKETKIASKKPIFYYHRKLSIIYQMLLLKIKLSRSL